MEKLPTESSRSFKEGNWFVFQDNGTWIRLWTSSTNGEEKFYWNDELLEERKNRTKFKITYEHKNSVGDHFELVLKVSMKLNKAGSICTLTKNDELIGRIEMLQNKEFMKVFRLILYPTSILVVIVALLIKIGKYSDWWIMVPIFFFISGTIYFIRAKIPIIKIEDTTDLIDD